MAFKYSAHSLRQRRTLHPYLRLIFDQVLLKHDFKMDQGGRSEKQQWANFNAGVSKVKPPKGKHLIRKRTGDDAACSYAVDVCPYIGGKRLATDKAGFGAAQKAQFAWFLSAVAAVGDRVLEGSGYRLRFGVDWDCDGEILTDQKFQDWFHVELVRLTP